MFIFVNNNLGVILKNKIKLSLVDDYIKIFYMQKIFQNTYFNSEYDGFSAMVNRLCVAYENLFFKIGFMDDKYLLLKQELNKINLIDFKFINILEKQQEINEIYKNLNKKLKKLKFNDVELNYINNLIMLN